jgi:hypothetical protein
MADDLQIDVLMTHGPPKYVLDLNPVTGESIGCPHLFRAVRRIKPRIHAFGHAHSGYGAQIVNWKDDGALPKDDDTDDGVNSKMTASSKIEERNSAKWARAVKERLKAGENTLFVNSASMDDGGKLENLPWLVEIDLQSDHISSG